MMRFGALLAVALALMTVSATAADSSLSEAANTAFLATNLKKPGVIERPSGLQYRIIQNGFGKQPGPFDVVNCYYKGSLINGSVFDSTEPGLPATVTVNKVIPGWREALTLMREGDHWQLVIPPTLAYGTRGAGNGLIPPNQTLVFDLELVSTAPPPKDEDKDQDGSQQ
jgi:FKBP-type peptidyl-prolyl cis-trans isomerase